jgi:hypothetical protein
LLDEFRSLADKGHAVGRCVLHEARARVCRYGLPMLATPLRSGYLGR